MFTLDVDVIVDGRSFDSIEDGCDFIEDSLTENAATATLVVGREMLASLNRVANMIRARHSQPWLGGVINPTPNLQRRTGEGLQSILESVRSTDNSINLVGARISTGGLTIHETGGVIRAKRSRYLTIPMPAAMDSRGVQLRARARDWDNTFVARTSRGTLMIFRKVGRRVVPLYLLKPSVRIPARLDLGKTFNSNLPHFEQRALLAIEKELDH